MADRPKSEQGGLTRRGFLATAAGAAGAAATGGLGVLAGSQAAAAPAPALPKRTLGRTGLKVTAFSLGGIDMQVPVLQAGVARGVNFIHCANGYGTLDRVAQVVAGKRKQIMLGLKYERTNRRDWEYLNRCLEQLKVDGVDILFFPLNSPEEARNREHLDFFNQVKKQRKARFIGLTSHGNMPATMQAAVEAGFWDVLMPAYPAMAAVRKELRPALDQAEKKKLGVVAMKTMTGLRQADLPHMQTVVKEVLADSSVTSLVKGSINFEQLDACLSAAGSKPTKAESEALQQYLAACAGERCLVCGQCPTCPRGVNIADAVRAFDYYYVQSGCVELAKATYAEIPAGQRPERCDNCGECQGKCPYGVDIARRVQASGVMLA